MENNTTPPSPSTAPEVDVRHEFERWMSQRGESAVYIGDGLYSTGAVCDQAEAFAAGIAIGRSALASRPAEVDDEGLLGMPKEAANIWYHRGLPNFDDTDALQALDDGTGKAIPLYTAEQYRQGQRNAVAAYKKKQAALQELADQAQENDMGYGDMVAAERARRGKSNEITELLNNPPYGHPDLYSRLHTALTNQVELAKKFDKLPQWFGAVRGLVDWLERETVAAPSHTTNKD